MKRKRHTSKHRKIPSPPHPKLRQEPLPGDRPKSMAEDPVAARRVQMILDSPSYRQADEDVNFLKRAETRGVRLQIDYQKPELLMQQHGIRHTIVVFGSTRISEPAAAQAKVDSIRERLLIEPDDENLQHRLAVAERVLAKSRYYDVAREFSGLVGKAGQVTGDGWLVVMTGGGPGIMEAANRGASDVGSESIGLNIRLPHEQYPNPYVTPELCFKFHYFALRKLHFLMRTRALVAFPGGFGTLDELFETLTLVQTRTIQPVPIVLVGESYWRQVLNVDFMVDEGVIDAEDRELYWYAETAEEIWEGIRQWHRANGTPHFVE